MKNPQKSNLFATAGYVPSRQWPAIVADTVPLSSFMSLAHPVSVSLYEAGHYTGHFINVNYFLLTCAPDRYLT